MINPDRALAPHQGLFGYVGMAWVIWNEICKEAQVTMRCHLQGKAFRHEPVAGSEESSVSRWQPGRQERLRRLARLDWLSAPEAFQEQAPAGCGIAIYPYSDNTTATGQARTTR